MSNAALGDDWPKVEARAPKGNASKGRRIAQRRARTRTAVAVARIVGEPGGSTNLVPLSRPVTFPAAPKRSQRRAPVNRFFVPRLMMPAKTISPWADRERTTTQQSPRVASRTTRASWAGRDGGVDTVDLKPVATVLVGAAGVETTVEVTEDRTP